MEAVRFFPSSPFLVTLHKPYAVINASIMQHEENFSLSNPGLLGRPVPRLSDRIMDAVAGK